MQSRGRFVKYEKYLLIPCLGPVVVHGKELCELDSLAFSTGKSAAALA